MANITPRENGKLQTPLRGVGDDPDIYNVDFSIFLVGVLMRPEKQFDKRHGDDRKDGYSLTTTR
jgi:hypothetical protein